MERKDSRPGGGAETHGAKNLTERVRETTCRPPERSIKRDKRCELHTGEDIKGGRRRRWKESGSLRFPPRALPPRARAAIGCDGCRRGGAREAAASLIRRACSMTRTGTSFDFLILFFGASPYKNCSVRPLRVHQPSFCCVTERRKLRQSYQLRFKKGQNDKTLLEAPH